MRRNSRWPTLAGACMLGLGTLLPLVVRGAGPAAGDIAIAQSAEGWTVTGPTLDALVAPDGCLTRLRFPAAGEARMHIPNFVKPGVGLPKESSGGSRGAYFYQDGTVLALPDIAAKDGMITANGEAAGICYAFSPGAMRWSLFNKTAAPMQFFIVLDLSIQAVGNGQGALVKTPAIALWPEVVCYQGKRRLKVAGLNRLWGPGQIIGQDWRQGHFQVLEATLAPREMRELRFVQDFVGKDELATVEGLAPAVPYRGTPPTQMVAPRPAAAAGLLTIYSPRDYQVFQRQTRTQGSLWLSGRLAPGADSAEYRLSGKPLAGSLDEAWQSLPLDARLRAFNVRVPAPAGGWYRLEFRARQGGRTVAETALEHVGVGEVFVGCGQSNSTNCGSDRTQTATKMVASFDGVEWRLADDPQLGTHDSTRDGSFWPAFGDAMYARYGVPVGVAATGQGGAPISTWRPGDPAFVWLLTRLCELGRGGFRAILWHQGESNTANTSEYYYTQLAATIAASHAVAGWYFPWFVAQTSYHNPKEPLFATTRDAQKRLWDEGLALPGPDTDTLVGDTRAGIHFNPKGLKAHGDMWAEKVAAYLDPLLAAEAK